MLRYAELLRLYHLAFVIICLLQDGIPCEQISLPQYEGATCSLVRNVTLVLSGLLN